jgi:hypothetical protein
MPVVRAWRLATGAHTFRTRSLDVTHDVAALEAGPTNLVAGRTECLSASRQSVLSPTDLGAVQDRDRLTQDLLLHFSGPQSVRTRGGL